MKLPARDGTSALPAAEPGAAYACIVVRTSLLPPREPELVPDTKELQSAEEALRHLDITVDMVPSIDWFLYGFVRKEAVLSSHLEGVEVRLTDLITVEAQPPTALDADVQDVCNYTSTETADLVDSSSPFFLNTGSCSPSRCCT